MEEKLRIEISTKLDSSAKYMLESMTNEELSLEELYEWFGYIRAIRDVAFEIGIMSYTNTHEYVEQALKILRERNNI